jgi:hypothetical protein
MNTIDTRPPMSKHILGAVARLATITKVVQDLIDEEFTPHPFQDGVNRKNVRVLMANYLAMSQAFPYLQAGAQRTWILDALHKNEGVGEDREITAAVANFLTADETGVKYVLDKHGVEGLPKMLDTDQFFHSNLLKKDLLALFGEAVQPDFSGVTAKYLIRLLADLENLDPVKRCAAMVAFERHAGTMIENLWESLSKLFPVSKDTLAYFRVHVGGDDPAEPYHVAMTARMIERLVPADRAEEFVQVFRDAYRLNFSWCQAICDQN